MYQQWLAADLKDTSPGTVLPPPDDTLHTTQKDLVLQVADGGGSITVTGPGCWADGGVQQLIHCSVLSNGHSMDWNGAR